MPGITRGCRWCFWLLWLAGLAFCLGGLFQPAGEPLLTLEKGGRTTPAARQPNLEAWLWQLPGAETARPETDPDAARITVTGRGQVLVAGVSEPTTGPPQEEQPEAAAAPSRTPASAAARSATWTSEEFYRLLQRYERELNQRDLARRADKLPRHWLTDIVRKYAKIYAVDPRLVWTVIRHESGFNPRAVSPKGAMGLMQLIPSTAALMGVSDPFDIEQNIHGGVRYLKYCLTRFGNNLIWALAAYNAGPDNVSKYQGCPPFAETREYVLRILRDYTGQEVCLPPPLLALPLAPAAAPAAANRTAPEKSSGLAWKIPEPKVKIGPPTWKIPLRPIIVLVKSPTPRRQPGEGNRLLARWQAESVAPRMAPSAAGEPR